MMEIKATCSNNRDIVGSGEKVVRVSCGISTPKGKVDVMLISAYGHHRCSVWGKWTQINVERTEKVDAS